MKVFISIDIEGVNGITSWDETNKNSPSYLEFKQQLQKEVNACIKGAKRARATEIYVKDAHDSARNLDIWDLDESVKLIRGWVGAPCSMMGGLDSSFDAVMFVGYHSPSRSLGNSLAHTMNTRIHHIKINGVIASEFTINSLYASYLDIPVAFLSGDLNLCNLVKEVNSNIKTTASKIGLYGATISNHPSVTLKEIEENAYLGLLNVSPKNKVFLPETFEIEIQYKNQLDAYSASFYKGTTLLGTDRIMYKSKDYYDCLIMLKFLL